MTTKPPEGTEWYHSAACFGMDTEVFFSSGQGTIKKICFECPVRKECLEDAFDIEVKLESRLVFGLRGGVSAAHRKKMLNEEREKRIRSGKLREPAIREQKGSSNGDEIQT